MENIHTEYGTIYGISQKELFRNGVLKECVLSELNELETEYGVLIPQYEDNNVRRKYSKSMAFYESGRLRSISLHKQTGIKTPAGKFLVEFITFYENGNIKRLFPLNGKLTGYWTEENEYQLSSDYSLSFIFGKLKGKIISIYFYENNSVKSITLWPRETVTIVTPIGKVEIRIGLSLYSDGRLKSFEPKVPTMVITPIGNIEAFDTNPLSIHGDVNSLVFYEDGAIKSLKTSTNVIVLTDNSGKEIRFEPKLKPNLLDSENMELIPLCIEFKDDKVLFNMNKESEFSINKYHFSIESYTNSLKRKCSDCSGCSVCG